MAQFSPLGPTMAQTIESTPVRLATWHGDFSRKGPGLLLHELLKDRLRLDPIIDADPDILLLTDIDYDAGHAALSAFQTALRTRGLDLPYSLAERPNRGMPSGLDLDTDGQIGGPGDAQGFGVFSGQGGMAMLSRYPLTLAQNYTALLWRDLPQALVTPNDPGFAQRRLSSSAHWVVMVQMPNSTMTLLTLAATPPVFDGPEDLNGRRNHDELHLWAQVMAGSMGPIPDRPWVVMGNFNLDPTKGEGLHEAVQTLLQHSDLQDPLPDRHTVTWRSTGPLRISYILPDARLIVQDAGIMPAQPEAGPHGLVWMDVTLDAPRATLSE